MDLCPLCYPLHEDVLVKTKKWRIILVNDKRFPGFCRLIWQNHTTEMSDLSSNDAKELLDVILQLEQIIKTIMNPDKINLASLGNIVPHLHWHIIPRFKDDSHFPESIWANAQRQINPIVLEKRYTLLFKLKEAISSQFA